MIRLPMSRERHGPESQILQGVEYEARYSKKLLLFDGMTAKRLR
jgi:hypothetical protein